MMATYPLLQIDAFTDRPLAGNPCAVVLDADDLDADTMQAVAAEMNLAETAFVTRSAEADFGARYFTPAVEIPLAGHPTLATVRALLDTGRWAPSSPRSTLTLELVDGPVSVDVVGPDADPAAEADPGRPGGELIVMSQRRPAWGRRHDPDEVAGLLGLEASDLLPGIVPETVSTGTPFLLLPLQGPDALRRAEMDIPGFRRYRERSDFLAAALFCLGGFTGAGDTAARILDAPPDLLEDPFTGSATGCMAAWLWREGLLESPRFVAEQGHWMGRPGHARVEVVGPPDDIETVRVGGTAVTVLEGELRI